MAPISRYLNAGLPSQGQCHNNQRAAATTTGAGCGRLDAHESIQVLAAAGNRDYGARTLSTGFAPDTRWGVAKW
jgi:hypothetical protein